MVLHVIEPTVWNTFKLYEYFIVLLFASEEPKEQIKQNIDLGVKLCGPRGILKVWCAYVASCD